MRLFQSGRLGVKICGITNKADAEMCIQAGADALGFNFFPGSKRFIDFKDNLDWIREISAIDRVAVVVNSSADDVTRLRDSGCFEWIQFHGDEKPGDCLACEPINWIRAVRAKDESTLADALEFSTPYLLVDSWSPQAYGGTGNLADWKLLREFTSRNPSRHIILAGGLNSGNVAEAIRAVQPAAVDVAGGVESGPRAKDFRLVREFIESAQASFKTLGVSP